MNDGDLFDGEVHVDEILEQQRRSHDDERQLALRAEMLDDAFARLDKRQRLAQQLAMQRRNEDDKLDARLGLLRDQCDAPMLVTTIQTYVETDVKDVHVSRIVDLLCLLLLRRNANAETACDRTTLVESTNREERQTKNV